MQLTCHSPGVGYIYEYLLHKDPSLTTEAHLIIPINLRQVVIQHLDKNIPYGRPLESWPIFPIINLAVFLGSTAQNWETTCPYYVYILVGQLKIWNLDLKSTVEW